MAKEQISIRLEPETLERIDLLAANEKRSRNNMIEVLIFEAIDNRVKRLIEGLTWPPPKETETPAKPKTPKK